MILLSPERMRKYDEYAIKRWGIPSSVLMENAGRNTYRITKERYLKEGRKILVICGKGNNGGDGFVFARYARRDGFYLRCFLLGKREELKGDAALNMLLFESEGGKIEEIIEEKPLENALREADLIVDAIFGTGLSKEVKGIEGKVIEMINVSGKTVIAIDIPSGLDGESGRPLGCAVKATHTFTYGYPKIGQVIFPGAAFVGKLTVVDICLPSSAQEEIGVDGYVIDGELIKRFLKNRQPESHKGDFGHVAVIAGSTGFTGAATMTSLSALKIGAGLVTLLVPRSLNPIMEIKLTEVMTYPVDDDGNGHFILSSFEEIKEFVANKDLIVLGPGLSRNEETQKLVRKIYSEIDKPFVIDADGINAFEGYYDLLKEIRRNAVFTPHPGELSRLLKIPAKSINEERIKTGKMFVKETGLILVLKGARTIVFNKDGTFYVNPTGNPSLAKGGSGDILTGFIAGLASQGYTLLEAAIFSTYLHGYLSDMWVEKYSEMDLLATDLLSLLGVAIRDIRDGKERIYIEKSL